MLSLASLKRLLQIRRVAGKYALAELLGDKAPWFMGPRSHELPRGERCRLALEELGPVFVKFGQALSTRPDLLPPDIAVELAKLQDQVPPFDGEIARQMVEASYGCPVSEVFESFDTQPLASASIAQVHAARLKAGEQDEQGTEVVVKVLRPNVREQIERDIGLMYTIAKLALRFVPDAWRLRPVEIVREYETVIYDELDLLREGSNASQLRHNWLGSELIYHPAVFFEHTRDDVLVLERVQGIVIDDIPALREAGVDFKVLAARGVEIFFKQVFRDNFFHADMHPGNIFVDVSDPKKPRYVALDFGIVGTLSPSDQRYLAENILAFFHRDYRRVAELHVESLWVPGDTRVDEFESAIRAVCEPIFQRPIKDISFGQFLMRLFQTARRFNMQVQPQLVLLQKTLLNIEGLGRQLYPDLDLWETAQPIMEDWMRQRLSPLNAVDRLRTEVPALMETLPILAQSMLRRLENGQPLLGADDHHKALLEQMQALQSANRRLAGVVTGATLVMSASLLFISQIVSVEWPVGLAALGVICWLWPLRERRRSKQTQD